MKSIIYLFEYFIFSIFFSILQLIPINLVSILGGRIFRTLGPFSKSHKVAISNYKKAFPNLNEIDIKFNVFNSWVNLGRTLFEISILNKILNEKNKRIEIRGIEHLKKIQDNNENVIFIGIHQANWELLAPIISRQGINLGAIYRHINNPYIDKYVFNKRMATVLNNKTFFTPKGKESARDILKAINKGLSMLVLIDQKDSAGINIKLFNHEVKTQLGFLKIARKYNLKIIPTQIIRKKINNFSIIFHHPLDPFKNKKSSAKVMYNIHKIIEKWIITNPNQWLWQHKRFD